MLRVPPDPEVDALRSGIPHRIGCRICMATASLTGQLGEAPDSQPDGHSHGTLSYAIYRCDEGHTTHAAFDSADGSLRIYEPENSGPQAVNEEKGSEVG